MTPKLRIVSPDRNAESEDSCSAEVMTNPLKTSCLINNHNYAEYLCDAVAGALEQDHPFDEIIVVDDGSSDGSLDRLRKRFGKRDRLQIVAKEHGGQLSCIQHAVQIAGGDLIFFLDSDDRQRPKLNREVQAIYQQHPSVDCVSVGYQVFGSGADREHRLLPTRDRGLSTVAAILHRQWVGAPTSCLSMRSSLLEKVLPYPRARAWQTRADDVLVLGSSIVGAHKFHLGKHLIDYQLHGRNHFAGRKWSSAYNMRYSLEVNRLTQWYIEKTGEDITWQEVRNRLIRLGIFAREKGKDRFWGKTSANAKKIAGVVLRDSSNLWIEPIPAGTFVIFARRDKPGQAAP
jgi:glycosyltransferase involved in cell wall biosynthesis